MATFYGQVKGNAKTTATRRGSMNSGIKASVQSWNGSLIMEMSYRGDELQVEIQHSEGSSFSGYTVFSGTMEQLLEKLAK